MRFEQALAAMREGKVVKRPTGKIWLDPSFLMEDTKVGTVMFAISANKNPDQALFNGRELLAEDWEIVAPVEAEVTTTKPCKAEGCENPALAGTDTCTECMKEHD